MKVQILLTSGARVEVERVRTIEQLERLAKQCGYDRIEFLKRFNDWRLSGDGQILSICDGAAHVRRLILANASLPWEDDVITLQGAPWAAPERLSIKDPRLLPKASGARPGDYIVYRKGGPVLRVLERRPDGTIHVETRTRRRKLIMRPEDFLRVSEDIWKEEENS